jgi:Uma2 family endonuclease
LPHRIPPLENGAHLSAAEFMRRYAAMLEPVKAELINGIVYMASPLRADHHGDPDGLMQGWLCHYAIATPGLRHSINATTRLGPDDVPQPDGSLRLMRGGQCELGEDGYLHGAPELAVEIAASSASIDVREKLNTYRRAGVREYLVWRTEDECIDWWQLEDDEFRLLPREADGTIRSRFFPGLWLAVEAMLDLDGATVMARLDDGLRSEAHAAFVAQLAAPP